MKSGTRLIQITTAAILTFCASGVLASAPADTAANTAENSALLDTLRASEPLKRLAEDWKTRKLHFGGVKTNIQKSWAWVEACPETADGKERFDTITVVMHQQKGAWKIVEWLPDEIVSAEDPAAAFAEWRAKFRRAHPFCPKKILPEKL